MELEAGAGPAVQYKGEYTDENEQYGEDELEDDPDRPGEKRRRAPSALAAFTRSLVGSLAFLFKRPVRLFRPVKMSTMVGLQAIAEEQRKTVTPAFVRSVIRAEGWRFFPNHILPPLVLNSLIGFTLFSVYTLSESVLAPLLARPSDCTAFFTPSAFLTPFISGSLAGAAQSLISAPLDNARLILVRRQRLLRHTDPSISRKARQRALATSKPFKGWGELLKDAVFKSSTLPSSTKALVDATSQLKGAERRKAVLSSARDWAKRGWSLGTLSLTKDAAAFGAFFTIFELGREFAKRVGYAYDGISSFSSSPPPLPSPTEKKRRRTALGLTLQAFLILVAGGLAGFSFSIVARPFERARGAIFEGRARWADLDGRLRIALDRGRTSETLQVTSRPRRRRRKNIVRHRGIGRSFMFARRRAVRKRWEKKAAQQRAQESIRTSRMRVMEQKKGDRPPLPSSFAILRQATREYGAMKFFFASRENLQRISEGRRGRVEAKVVRAVPKLGGPTRLSARGRIVKEAAKPSRWARGAMIFTFLPPYACGLLAYAALSGDLK